MARGRVAQETLLQSGMCLPWKNLPPLVVENQLPSRNPKISSFQWEMLGWGMQSFGLCKSGEGACGNGGSGAGAAVTDAQVIEG